MKGSRGRYVLAVLIVLVGVACTYAWTRSAATVPTLPGTTPILKVDTKQPGNVFDHGAVGLSVDANELDSGDLSANHPSLVHLMRLIGPSVLRIGGDSVDESWWTSNDEPPPRGRATRSRQPTCQPCTGC